MHYTIHLEDAFKQSTFDQDKVLPPEETVRRFRKKLKKIDLDILEKIIRIDNGRLDIPVYFSICGKDALSTIGTQKQMGKGATPEQARASAIMELAERFSFFSFIRTQSNFKHSTFKDLPGSKISFDHIARSVHDDSDDLPVSRQFFESIPMNWAWSFNMTTGEPQQIPFDWFFTINEFNGPSAGNCKEEAILQGICEIVERHACSLVSRSNLPVPGIDPKSATDPMVVEMLAKYRNAGIDLYFSDFSLDLGIPTVAVLAHDPSTFPQKSEIVWTAGTTPCPHKSLSRALTEAAQLGGDFNTGSNYVASGLPKLKSLSDGSHIISPNIHHSMADLPNLADNNIRCEVESCIQALSSKGMDVYVIDIMHPAIGIPAFYTIVPGAHFRERAIGTSIAMFCAKIVAENQPPQKSIPILMEMESKLPGKYFIHFFLGSCHSSLGNTETALQHFSDAMDHHPNLQDIPSICSYMALCYRDMEKYREALAVLHKGASLDDERTDIFNLMGFCHFKLKNYEMAIDSFKKVLTLDPSSAIDYANIGSNYREMGKTKQAIQYYELALELDPSIGFARTNIQKLRGI